MKSDKETKLKIRRVSLHILTGLGILFFLFYYDNTKWLLFYAVIIGIFLSFISQIARIPVISWFIDNFELEKHKKVFPGKSFIFFLAGSLLAIHLFPKDIALASIAILTFLDPAAHFIRRKTKSRKNIINFIFTIPVAFLASVFFIPARYAILASVIAVLAESLIIKVWEDYIDDNFLVPIIAGTTIHFARLIY